MLLNSEKIKEKKGITESGKKKQKKYKYQKVDGTDTCSICVGNIQKGDKVYELICHHIFHEDCIGPWFKQSHICPNCRKDLN